MTCVPTTPAQVAWGRTITKRDVEYEVEKRVRSGKFELVVIGSGAHGMRGQGKRYDASNEDSFMPIAELADSNFYREDKPLERKFSTKSCKVKVLNLADRSDAAKFRIVLAKGNRKHCCILGMCHGVDNRRFGK